MQWREPPRQMTATYGGPGKTPRRSTMLGDCQRRFVELSATGHVSTRRGRGFVEEEDVGA